MKVRGSVAAALIGFLSIFPGIGGAFAQSGYPDHTVRIIVGFAAGGPVDIIARIMGDRLTKVWGQPVVVENIPGSGGNIAGGRAAKAAPDGYTLLMSSNAQLAINPSLYSKMPYDAAKDFVPITLAVYSPNVLVIPNDIPAKNVGELVAYARSHPGTLTFGSAGTGTTQHLAGELFKTMAHIDIQHVPYSGAAPVITDLLAGRITMFFGAVAPLIPLIQEGKLRALAVTSAKRFAALPDLPTMIESGFPGFESILSLGLVAPAGTPPAVIEKIHKDSVAILALPDVRKRLADIGMDVIASSPSEFAAVIKAETPQWAKVIKEAGIRASD
ncbi:MAG TPA: tripartite tricarboxylate transporter substrate binding protein [Pseudolabrys sp.]|nr:tripartite tricarboxylate transporter substrate binding protein [Pseudolabrys sp.]